MTAQKIFNALQEILVGKRHATAEEITLETRFYEDLHMDSLDCAEFFLDADYKLETGIETDDVDAPTTVGDVVKLVQKNYEKYNS